MEIRKDIVGNIPKIGDLIAFNPPSYKGLILGTVNGFSSTGLPKLSFNEKSWWKRPNYTPKTGFVVVNSSNYEIY